MTQKKEKERFKISSVFKWIWRVIYSPVKLIYIIYSPIYDYFNKNEKIKTKPSEAPKRHKVADVPKKVSQIRVVDSLRGQYRSFWNKLSNADSLIGIIIGARGSGESAIAMSFAENLKNNKKKFFAMGFSSRELPRWIKSVDDISALENDSYVIIDEGGILFSSRDSMSTGNKLLSELLFIARHKNLTIFFISQNSSNLEINTLRQADFLVLKRSSLLQRDFERKIISKIYEEHEDGFEKYKDVKGLALIYSDSFLGFIENELPSFWSDSLSKSFK